MAVLQLLRALEGCLYRRQKRRGASEGRRTGFVTDWHGAYKAKSIPYTEVVATTQNQ